MKPTTIICLFVLAVFSDAKANAQSGWYSQSPVPTGNTLTAVWFSDAKTATAVGYNGTIVRTTDGGTSWTPQESGTTATLFAVAFTDANTGTAVGGIHFNERGGGSASLPSAPPPGADRAAEEDSSVILRTTNGGTTWNRQSSGVTSALLGVCFMDARTGIAVGVNGTILRTTDGGDNWILQPSSTTEILRGVSFSDLNNGLTVGGDAGGWGRVHWSSSALLRTTDGGATWTSQATGTSTPLLSVCFINAALATALAVDSLLKTTDGGETWTKHYLGPSISMGMTFPDANAGVVVGYGNILRTTDGGATWESHPSGASKPLMGVHFIDANHGTAVGAGGTIVRTDDGGQSWQRQGPKGTMAHLNSVSFSSTTDGAAVGWKTTDVAGWGRSDAVVLRTTDGGSSWSEQVVREATLLTGISFGNADTGFAVGWGNKDIANWQSEMQGFIFRTADGGATWTCQASIGEGLLHGVFFSDAHNGTVVGEDSQGRRGIIFHTTNSGSTWIDQWSGTPAMLLGVCFSDANTGTVVGHTYSNSGNVGTILRTTNGGNTWITQRSETKEDLYGVSFADFNTGIAVGTSFDSAWQSSTTILRTTNGGATWLKLAGEARGYLQSVCFSDALIGYAAGDGIYRTTDAGATWTRQPSPATHFLASVSFADATTGCAVGSYGTIIRTTTGGLTWAGDDPKSLNDLPKSLLLEQNYPNPFNPTTTIRYTIAGVVALSGASLTGVEGRVGNVKLVVYDVLGREVATLVNEVKHPGTYTVQFDGSGLASGMYIYRLTVGDAAQAKKLVVLR